MSNYVFLIDANKKPMNPVHPSHARKLLDSGKASVFRRYPFTLLLKRVVENIVVHPLTLKIDPGSKVTGISLVTDRNEAIWGVELEHRGQQIEDALQSRRAVRRGRRNRNTRYRQARYFNRKRPQGWLAPSLMHRVLTTETWIKRLRKFAPIGDIKLELVQFDTQQLENPEISGIEYQQGELQGYEVREYLLEKWARKCAYCDAENIPLQIEHIQARAKGGSNRIYNLCLACEKCNLKKASQDIRDFLKGKSDLASRILSWAKSPLKDAAAMNSTRWKLFKTLKVTGLLVTTGTGGQTKFNRTRLGLPKEHWIDAACVGVTPSLKILTTRILRVKATGMGGRQRCQTDKFGYPQKHRPLRPIFGFCTGDIVRADVPKGKYKGTFTARVCPMSDGRGEFVIDKKRRSIRLEYCTTVHRKDGYSYA
ncbi:MAG: HNH endonuclease [Microcoleus sp. PH2017_01_SCD_O_A]|jgi:5-methylcytosine-specific restriction endonuclease McrA|uniref:RNA-guided endonuclease IscB n=1 Tax=Microcoleus sp. PH2017_01_SCD_O_A TaxID=2798812 RepID=UPI001DA120FC|nr:RNA-guided endonuclease IscB [Microcoleus sp. PH2017_01_SCD_O_A]MCC3421917.1 HNH endonuclease [Microcoleus sp. PH2017_07_MST_O_A]MCC3430591.1 HNH endonuclease [Microcoleus sp. PH2017_04_SCI_O_A]MCC3468159.1 HNH endonuclease [Microcoleus sp. PH2017_06_SFM_O_A]MCC3508250.1 HNH endonuclease [Microcoleus sp. PH2017_17_BER_D_A]TAE66137.1 MAG: HNH endonuclease [Oscillatoriales cyanobacterium]